ncbi:L-glutamate gamma-semialdehyde dehydrogenase [bacterium]|nr:L-glutamate gamma-semialdehyde dehydrogenase [bacterium]
MSNYIPKIPVPGNEPVLGYAPGSAEKAAVKAELKKQSAKAIDIPCIINGRNVRTGKTGEVVMPHEHGTVIAKFHMAGAKEAQRAIDAALKARPAWAALPWQDRAAVFLKAADLLAGPYRAKMNASTMLGQGKNIFQSEIDAVCELADFWRFNCWYAEQIYADQPPISPSGIWNQLEHRPLDGFIFAITPFNFTSIQANLPTAPALMGNVAVWKPSETAMHSAALIMEILHEAGLPEGVVNMLPGDGPTIGNAVLHHPDLAGVHFTGSTATFQYIQRVVADNLPKYRNYPRVVGETGGKDFVFVHESADPLAVAVALVRGAFEYQGQKCSAASRAYVPAGMWPKVRQHMAKMLSEIKVGDPRDFRNFVNAVIDRRAYDKITGYIKAVRRSKDATIEFGGEFSDKVGFFIDPTVILAKKPDYRTMVEEIFGPVLTIHVYKEKDYEKMLGICNETSPYALTGSIFARDRRVINHAAAALADCAGNFYINDKPTGAVVGQQPFGGARASGTNDKAGSALNLLRWVSPRTIKEAFVPPTDYRYPFLAEE